MAGTDDRFDATAFRDGIKFAMDMGLPTKLAERPTFHFRATRTYPGGTALDAEGYPFDPSIAPTTAGAADVQVSCAIEFIPAGTLNEISVGSFRQTRVIITLLDTQYALVKDAIEVSVGGDRYIISYIEPPTGLFDVTIYRMVCIARDEK